MALVFMSGCATQAPSAPPQPEGGVETAAQAVVVAERLTTVVGPWVVGDVERGPFERLWQGSTSDLSGAGTAARAFDGPRVVWRVDLTGPNGWEELYIDATTRELVDAITQGS
jgi:hypothetical protein